MLSDLFFPTKHISKLTRQYIERTPAPLTKLQITENAVTLFFMSVFPFFFFDTPTN
jgi:hypothetical protein